MASSSSAWVSVLGNPSRITPFLRLPSTSRSRIMPRIILSSTNLPASMIDLAFLPNSVPLAIASRNMSPVDSWTKPYLSIKRVACVPLPAPGGPRRINIIFSSLASWIYGSGFHIDAPSDVTEPVSSYPESLSLRLASWCHQNKTERYTG